MEILILVGILVGVAVLLGFVGVWQLFGSTVDDRLSRYVRTPYSGALGSDVPIEPVALAKSSLAVTLDRALERRDLVAGLRRDLSRADLPLTVPEFLLVNIVLVLVSFLLGFLISRFWVSGLVLAIAAAFLPKLYLTWRHRRRIAAFNNQLGDVVNLLIGALRAGYGLLQSLDYIARRLPDPVAKEFGRVVREVSLGLGINEALANLMERVESDDLELMVTAISIHHEVGGNLTTILESISNTIRERVRIKREIRSLTSMQRGSAYILVTLPFLVGGVLFLLSPAYMMRLFAPGATLCIPFGAVVLMALGFIITRRIVAIEV